MSFRLKTIFGIAIIELLLVTILIAKGTSALKQDHESELKKTAAATTKIYADAIEGAILGSDIATISSVAESMSKASSIAIIQVEGADKSLLLDKTYQHIPQEQLMSFEREILIQNIPYGKVRMGFDQSQFHAGLKKHILDFLLIGLAGLASSFLLSYLLGTYLVSSLKRLSQAAAQVAGGDFSKKVQVGGRDEIASLANSFNEMMAALQEDRLKIAEQQKALTQSARLSALGEMAAGIAHEIRNPLMIIETHAEKIDSRINKEPLDKGAIHLSLEKIKSMNKRITVIANGLSKLARGDQSGDAFTNVPLRALIEEALELAQSRLKKEGIELRTKLEIDAELEIQCRPIQISQVLLNLLNNAIDAIQGNKELWIEIGAAKIENKVVLSVTDSGHGIAPEKRTEIFKPFFTTKAAGKGTGLGLAIVKGIIDTHMGNIFVDASATNTRFVIELQQRLSESSSASQFH